MVPLLLLPAGHCCTLQMQRAETVKAIHAPIVRPPCGCVSASSVRLAYSHGHAAHDGRVWIQKLMDVHKEPVSSSACGLFWPFNRLILQALPRLLYECCCRHGCTVPLTLSSVLARAAGCHIRRRHALHSCCGRRRHRPGHVIHDPEGPLALQCKAVLVPAWPASSVGSPQQAVLASCKQARPRTAEQRRSHADRHLSHSLRSAPTYFSCASNTTLRTEQQSFAARNSPDQVRCDGQFA